MKTLRRWLPRTAVASGRADGPPPQTKTTLAVVVAAPVLDGLDLDATVRRLGIPLESLRPLLLRFADGQRKTLDELRAAVAAGDSAKARGHAHALAGASGNLGAERLREASKALEMAAKDGRSALAALAARVEQEAVTAFRSIDTLRPPAASAVGGAPAAAAIEPARLRTPLSRLKAALEDSDVSGCDEALQELAQLPLPDGQRRQATRLQELIEGYEYDEAGAVVDRLLAGLPVEAAP